VGGAIAVGLLLSGCTSTPAAIETTTAPEGGQQDPAHALPDFCDQLLPPLTVAAVLERDLAGGRSAQYDAPQPANGVVAGMTCRYGVEQDEVALTVTGRDHTDEQAARADLRDLIRSTTADAATGADPVRIVGARGDVVDTASSSTCFVRDGTRTVVVTMRSSVVGSGDPRGALLEITSAAVQNLPRP
jgi:hypothetical protein